MIIAFRKVLDKHCTLGESVKGEISSSLNKGEMAVASAACFSPFGRSDL